MVEPSSQKPLCGVVLRFGKGRKTCKIYVQGDKLYFMASELGTLAVLVDSPPLTIPDGEKEAYVIEDEAVKVCPSLGPDLAEIRQNVFRSMREKGIVLKNEHD